MQRAATTKEKRKDVERIWLALQRPDALTYQEYHDAGGKYKKSQIFYDGDTWLSLLPDGVSGKPVNIPRSRKYYLSKLQEWYEDENRLPKSSERTKAKLAGIKWGPDKWEDWDHFIDDAISKGYIPPQDRRHKRETADNSSTVSSAIPTTESEKTTRRIPPPPVSSFVFRRNPKWERIDIDGLPYAPQDETAVIALFAILCHRQLIPYQILDLTGGKGIDAICYDEKNDQEKRVEFKLVLKKSSFGHSLEEVDVIVCWQNSWETCEKPVIELASWLRKQNVRSRLRGV